MGRRWNPFGFQLSGFGFAVLILLLKIHECVSLSLEGLALLRFRERVNNDPNRAFANWDPSDTNPCMWLGVHCVDGKVQMLDLKGLWLEGVLGPELGELSHLRSLVLYRNHFSGFIPKEIGRLKMLELLDLRNNNLSGRIPAEIRMMPSLKHLLVSGNKIIPPKHEEFDLLPEPQLDENLVSGNKIIPSKPVELDLLLELQLDEDLTFASRTGRDCINTKFGHCIWESSLQHLKKAGSAEQFIVKDVDDMVNIARRRRLLQSSYNLPAAAVSSTELSQLTTPFTLSSGAFPAVNKHSPLPSNPSLPSPPDLSLSAPNPNTKSPQKPVHQPSAHHSPERNYFHAIPGVVFLFVLCAVMLYICRKKAGKAIAPWKTGISGQLQKALVTGVSKLNRAELEAACEDFSNILDTFPGCKVYKGTLSSGVEIAVASTTIASFKEWSRHAEVAFKKRIEKLSRINHRNFVNILGYCQEDEPFTRMMVFEYAPNGNLYEHLHVKEVEHLDWNARVRIIMGVAYCLEHMHHVLNPPLVHPHLHSSSILLTEDCAAKVAEISFWMDLATKSKIADEEQSEHSLLHPEADPESNVYSFGIMLLEIISGKVPYNEEQGSLVNWATEYLNGQKRISYMIDPSLKSFKNTELDVICEIIQECINEEPKHRPTMKDIVSSLRNVIAVSPDQATPKLSPLWWAELQILSVEAS
uniref:Protein kinase domain-containing protein n=1 Tax=Vitis vinifera TaxID=29760 RepID=A5AJA2_VITVI|nr:hypothetical protein VITISV_017762 [Vitis vinifera]